MISLRLLSTAALVAPILASCAVGPDYLRPSAPTPVAYKELKGWKKAAPADGFDRGAWWAPFKDAKLDALLRQVEISNQTVAAAAANYDQARALVREAQASLFPTLGGNYTATRSGQGAAVSALGRPTASTTFEPQATASWDIDVWGKIRRQIESNSAGVQVSAADLANAKLSAQAQLAIAYFNLRAADSLKDLLHRTAAEYKRTVDITQNQYNSGTVSKADLITAQTQLYATQAQEIGVGVQRGQYEHAIAMLTGRPPADLSLAPALLPHAYPLTPVALPSTLLERRPDIAAAERQMQENNALIGVALAAYYPDISLSGAAGFIGANAFPFTAAHQIGSLGAAAADPIFEGGLRAAQVDAARAVYNQSVANYRQTVLTAFQQVEDQLVALRVQANQLAVQEKAVRAAREAVDVYLNQYRAGTVPFTTVVVAEATLLSDEEAALTTRQNLFVARVTLIEFLGGGWDASQLPAPPTLSEGISLLPRS